MRLSPTLKRAAVTAAAGIALVTGLSGTAQANPGHDFQNPVSSGCAADAYTARSQALYADGARVGTIELRYSPSCRAVWTRVYSNGSKVDGSTHRNETSTYSGHCINNLWDAGRGQYYCYTLMLDDAGYTSFGEGIAWNSANTRSSNWSATTSY
ncbi:MULTISPECIES: DUF2690 domain-containing protein [unclassified Streptomyces]|uniref:DUF2690 domain-containing protein n=1 Tax=unclassified Streptomyces TaxID=2593676 RepID=UPI00163CF4D4|nr:DUF2690 domain-containing protein [Streptomyces sp. WAC01280]